MKQQTAVEWLEEQINLTFYVAEASEMNKRFQIVFQQAKEMEKEQIIDAYSQGGLDSSYMPYKYYNETFEPEPNNGGNNDSLFNEEAIKDAAINWCEFTGYDSKDDSIINSFIMGAKLGISNDGWKNFK